MTNRLLLLILSLLLIVPSISHAQKKTRNYYKYQHSNNFDDWDDFDLFEWNQTKPMMEFTYGIAEPKHRNFSGKFSKLGLAELKLGYRALEQYYKRFLLDNDERYLFVSFMNKDLYSAETNGSLNSEFWRFGFARRSGFGYGFEGLAFLPYSAFGFAWTKLDMKDNPVTPEDIAVIERFDDTFRFGTIAEGGVAIEFASFLSFNASYEASVIFPRHLFWKHLGSFAIEMVGFNITNYFLEEIIDSSPAAGPILGFLLQNGYSYAFYLLKRDNMNWPFETEAPLTFETLKFGLRFSF